MHQEGKNDFQAHQRFFEPRLLFKRKCFAFFVDVKERKSLILVYILKSFISQKTSYRFYRYKKSGVKLLQLEK